MDKELNQYLAKRYNRIFPQRVNQKDFSWGFECNNGWFKLLNHCCNQLQNHIDSNNKQYEDRLLYQSYIDNNELDKLPPWVKMQVDKGEKLTIGEYCPQIVALQIKEKFGTLRFYYQGGDSFCRGVVSLAESISGSTCEQCGDEAQSVSNNGFVQVLCQKHAKKFTKYKYSEEGSVNVLMPGGYEEMKIVQALSDTELIAENAKKLKVHAFKEIHSKVEYWNGMLLESSN